MMKEEGYNVFGEPLMVCGTSPLTGAFRNGCCDTGPFDVGTHTVCAIVTQAFLDYSKQRGNDLARPLPQYNFPGLIEGDRWCLCISRWKEAHFAGVAPPVILAATHQKTLEVVPLSVLERYALKK